MEIGKAFLVVYNERQRRKKNACLKIEILHVSCFKFCTNDLTKKRAGIESDLRRWPTIVG